jgi:DNA-binding IclR family transcriptional regulator
LGYVYTVSVTDPGKYRDAKSVLAVLVDSGMVEHDLHADRYRLLPGMLRRARAVLAVAFA